MYTMLAFGTGEVTFPLGRGHTSSTAVRLNFSCLHLPSSLADYAHIRATANQDQQKPLYIVHFYLADHSTRHLSLHVVSFALNLRRGYLDFLFFFFFD